MRPSANQSIDGASRMVLPEFMWEEIKEAGAYVERGTGDLYRIPKEALIAGASPIVIKESNGASRMVQISKNPFVTTFEARLRCARYNIPPNF